MITRSFKTKNPRDPKYVEVMLFDSGKWKPFVLDSKFPVEITMPRDKFGESGPPNLKYCKPLITSLGGNNAGTWMIFLEKALAKLYGGYNNLCLCNPGTITNELLGAPINYISLADEGFCYRNIEDSLKAKS